MEAKSPELQILAREQGTAIWFLGSLAFVKATAQSTGGAFGLIEHIMPAGFATPYHVHQVQDEVFYVLEGELRLYSQGRQMELKAGGYAFFPPAIQHGFCFVWKEPGPRGFFFSLCRALGLRSSFSK